MVIIQNHYEPCVYYAFGNKIEAEKRDLSAGIRIPKMLAIDLEYERIVKEYIEGPTMFDLVRDGSGMWTMIVTNTWRSMTLKTEDFATGVKTPEFEAYL